ncbi:restriction endonuclease subunit S [Globicatella sulfidifaciens]|uniref:Restriction endonuclease subunit S n=1 Tax=Globicatella sulfidifaciens TaxID=136093 RepID=A0A7X8H117_9LACT|nr:restriction endonuclease subunit S [Globicatella sulfidifaciens]NLJ19121.1 restriction endonuclease subunit S [Globicatella sulfidifaciens]
MSKNIYKLKEVADITMGQSPKSEYYNENGDGTPFLQGNSTFRDKYPTIEKFTTKETRISKKNSVLMSVRAPVGEININPLERICVGRGLCSISLHNKQNEYLYYYLKSKQKLIQSKGTGTVFSSINKKDVKNIEIYLPEIREIEARTLPLKLIDDKIENNNAIIANLEEQAQTIFKSWFVDFEPFQEEEFVESELGEIPKGWKIVRFDELIDFKNGFSFKSKEINDTPRNIDDLKVFKMGDIKVGGGINPNKTKSWVTREYVKNNKLEKFIAEKGLLLMCMTDMKNNVRLLGHTALINSSDEYIINQRVGMIKPKLNSSITSSFLYILTNNDKFLSDLRSRANSGVQVNLSTKEIKNSLVILPKDHILNQFNQISEDIFEHRFNLEKQNENLMKIRDTLLPKLMSGEIRVEEAIEVKQTL